MEKLCGENPREDGKIRLFLDKVGSQRVKQMPLAGFLGSN